MFSITSTPDFLFGCGSANQLPEKIQLYGNKILLCTGKSTLNQVYGSEVESKLKSSDIDYSHVIIGSEPTSQLIDSICSDYNSHEIAAIVAIGGGSVIDAGKAIAAMLPVGGTIVDYLEDVGTKQHPGTKLPFIAMPTTAGTGSEMTKNAVICDREAGYKKSLRHDNFIPDIAIVDPEFLKNCPADILAGSGLDALTQLIESYTSTKSNIYTDSLAFDAIIDLVKALPKAFSGDRSDVVVEALAYAAMISGITLANAGLGLVHGFATTIGGLYDIPHGVICGTLVGEINHRMLQKAKEDNNIGLLQKYSKLGMALAQTEGVAVASDLFVNNIGELVHTMNIPKFSEYGIAHSELNNIVTNTGHKNNPIQFDNDELTNILKARL